MAAADGDKHRIRPGAEVFLKGFHGVADFSGADAASGQEEIVFLFGHAQALGSGGAVLGTAEGRLHRNAEGQQLLPGDAPGDKIFVEDRAWGHIVVAVRLLGEGNTGVIGGNEYGLGNRDAPALHGGENLRRKHVGHENHVAGVIRKVVLQNTVHFFIHIIHGNHQAIST